MHLLMGGPIVRSALIGPEPEAVHNDTFDGKHLSEATGIHNVRASAKRVDARLCSPGWAKRVPERPAARGGAPPQAVPRGYDGG